MTLPPVVRRLREKPVWGGQLREFVAKQFPSREKAGSFGELFDRFVDAIHSQTSVFLGLSEEDPYWKSAPQDQNLMSALGAYLLSRVEQGQDDEERLWALAAMAVGLRSDNEFGREYWFPLVLRDLRNIRWLVESALWVWLNSGHDTTGGLYHSQVELAREHKGVYYDLGGLCSDPNPRIAIAARIAFEVGEGSRLPELWLRYSTAFE